MSNPIDDGGPAFPATVQDDRDCGPRYAGGYGGMSLRDFFAGQALAGEMASQSQETGEWVTNIPQDRLEARSSLFYRFADAMITARKATK